MAAQEILAVGATEANSADITVAAGAVLAVGLNGMAGAPYVYVKLKDASSGYNVVDYLNTGRSSFAISAPGVYRFTRLATGTCGVYGG